MGRLPVCAALPLLSMVVWVSQPLSGEAGAATLTWAVQNPLNPVYTGMAQRYQKRYGDRRIVIKSFDGLSDLVNILLDDKPALITANPSLALECMETGLFADLSPYLRKDGFWGNFIKGYMGNMGKKGKTYAVPYFATVSALNYNKALFNGAGLKYPDQTWNYQKEYIMAARKLTRDRNGDGRKETYGLVGGTHAEWLPVFYSWGAEFLSMDGLKLLFTDRAAKDSLTWVQGLHKEGLADVRDPRGEEIPLAKAPFVDGRTGMLTDTQPWTGAILNTLPKGVRLDVGFTSTPAGPKGCIPVGRAMATGMYVQSKQKADAARFIRFLYEPAQQVFALEKYMSMPTTKDLLRMGRVAGGPDFSRDPLAKSYEKARTFGADGISRMILDGVEAGMYGMVHEGMTPEQLIKAAKDEFYKLLLHRD